MSRDNRSESEGQRSVAELLAAYGGKGGGGRRRRRRAEDPTDTAPQAIIDRVLSESGNLRRVEEADEAPGPEGQQYQPPPRPAPVGQDRPTPSPHPEPPHHPAEPDYPRNDYPQGDYPEDDYPTASDYPRGDYPVDRGQRGQVDGPGPQPEAGARPAFPAAGQLPADQTVLYPVDPDMTAQYPPLTGEAPAVASDVGGRLDAPPDDPHTEQFPRVAGDNFGGSILDDPAGTLDAGSDAERTVVGTGWFETGEVAAYREDGPDPSAGPAETRQQAPVAPGVDVDPDAGERPADRRDDADDHDYEPGDYGADDYGSGDYEPDDYGADDYDEDYDEDDSAEEGVEEPAEKPVSPVKEWLLMIGQLVVGVVGGAGLWLVFQWLWLNIPAVALVVALLVITGMVFLVRKIRRSDDLQTTLFTVLVGLIVTVSPAALLLLGT
ncbi:hypothetical protein C1701_12695 [Actinoalloteichus sp. AHMU CJ021]|uniref:hypothetical protein n=1 Tax=Actinoalloteichus sp. AHMU CJ021 TaxID=2072503 RepID=UPI000CA071F0|nr:hypothetical protein C1701_12695 [Actinoalloteichus sp. AHMU CJ021]